MILMTMDAVSVGSDLSVSMDINFGPASIAATSGLNGFFLADSGVGFAGFSQLMTVDPNTGNAGHVDLKGTSYFQCSPVAFSDNCNSITFVVGAADSGGSLFVGSFTHNEGWCQVMFFQPDGGLG